jgi:hypothetical protein
MPPTNAAKATAATSDLTLQAGLSAGTNQAQAMNTTIDDPTAGKTADETGDVPQRRAAALVLMVKRVR